MKQLNILSVSINKIKFWFNYIFDKDYRYQIRFNKSCCNHVCYNCGNIDWQGYEIIGGLCNDCRKEEIENEKNI